MEKSISSLQEELIALMKIKQYAPKTINSTNCHIEELKKMQIILNPGSNISHILRVLEQHIYQQYKNSEITHSRCRTINRIIYRLNRILEGNNPFFL